jgi:hypothetical protein
MSSQLDLAALAEKTHQRLTRLTASATSAGERLFSPSTARSQPTVAFLTPQRSSDLGASVHAGGVGDSGELSLSSVASGGGAGDLSLFIMSPDLKRSLCLRAVSRGLKFCTLGASHCTFTTHSKKVDVVEGDLYLSAGRNSGFSNHHIPKTVLMNEQLRLILQERHTKDEWV